jgi:hypothetical protein
MRVGINGNLGVNIFVFTALEFGSKQESSNSNGDGLESGNRVSVRDIGFIWQVGCKATNQLIERRYRNRVAVVDYPIVLAFSGSAVLYSSPILREGLDSARIWLGLCQRGRTKRPRH